MSAHVTVRAAGVYCRISKDVAGLGLGVDRQERECRDLAARRGWPVYRAYVDNDLSASTGRRRPAYEELLRDVEAGSVDAVLAWAPDRLHRRPIELERFVQVIEHAGVAVATCQAGDLDLGSAAGRAVARTLVAWARHEVEQKSDRQRAANKQRLARGLPLIGRRLFGYDKSTVDLEPFEAAWTRWAVSQVLDGVPIRTLCRAAVEQGVTTTMGGPWRPTELRRYLCNPRLAGLLTVDGQARRGTFPAILSEAEHRAVVVVLTDPQRRKAGPPRRYLLSGLARCGADDCTLTVLGSHDNKRGGRYKCSGGLSGHPLRLSEPIDAYVVDVLLARLARPDARASLTERVDVDDALATLRDRASWLETRQAELGEAYATGQVDKVAFMAASARLGVEADVVETSMRPLLLPALPVGLATASDIRDGWANLDLDGRRQVIAAFLDVTILPTVRGRRGFDPESVQITWTV